MSQQSPGPAGPGRDDWPDDLWPDEDDNGVAADGWPAPSTPPGWRGGRSAGRRFNPATLAVVVVVAVVAGAGIALAVQVFSPSSAPASSHRFVLGPGAGGRPGGSGQPGAGGQGGSPVGGFPGGGSGVTGRAFLVGVVLKVDATSITIGGPGQTVTAGVTGSTRISGKVSAISGLKVGDQVSAQISESGGKATVVAIQYPAQLPNGGAAGG